LTSSFGSFAVELFYLISSSESKEKRIFFGQVFSIIANSGKGFNLLIENLDFVFINGESDSSFIEFES
jgi:hypothetical protein